MCFVNPIGGPILRLGFVAEAFTLLSPLALPFGILRVLRRGEGSGPGAFRRRGVGSLTPFVRR